MIGSLKVTPIVMRDFVARLLGRPPVMVPIAATPGQLALMNAHDALPGYQALMPKGTRFISKRTDLLDASALFEQAALDRYVFLRDAYLQRRRSLIYDGNPPRPPRPQEPQE